MLFTGKGGQAFFLAIVLGPLLMRWINQWKAKRTFGAGGRRESQASEVETASFC